MAYPDPAVTYGDSDVAAWLPNWRKLSWAPPDADDPPEILGYVTGPCPRCGHTISEAVYTHVIAGINPTDEADELHSVGVICDCIDDHKAPTGKSGCGAGFELTADDIRSLTGFPTA